MRSMIRIFAATIAVGWAGNGVLAAEPSIQSGLGQKVPAFTGAVGYGAGASGWRGGEVMAVTTLANRGPGSLRTCAATKGRPRVCVFQVSGTIGLRSPIRVGSNVYIAGQTAPGQGIQLKLDKGNNTPLLIKNSNNVLVRFLKVRPGIGTRQSVSIDSVTIEGSHTVYLDRMSMQFASDETVNVHVNNRPTRDITIARSIVGPSLDRSVHPKGKHSKGALICSNEHRLDAGIPCGNVTLYGNIFAHNRDRNPDLKATVGLPIEVINNIFYNAISQFGEFYNLLGELDVRYIGNIALLGPDTRRKRKIRAIEGFAWDPNHALKIYVRDSSTVACRSGKVRGAVDKKARGFVVETEGPGGSGIVPVPQAGLLSRLEVAVGAGTKAWGGLDALDQSVIDQVKTCGGKVIDTVEEVGGWPNLPEQSGPVDTDGDGMPDQWETAQGLDPADAKDGWADKDQNGRFDLEDYLAALAGDPAPSAAPKR